MSKEIITEAREHSLVISSYLKKISENCQGIYFSFLLTIFLFGFTNCSSSDEPETNIRKSPQSKVEYNLSDATMLNPEQLATLHKLESINDSIQSSSYNDSNFFNGTRSSWYFDEIVISDTKGFFDGLRYGLSHGKGIWGKITTSTACAISFGIAYSLVASIVNIFAQPAQNKFTHNDIMLCAAATCDVNYVKNKLHDIRQEEPQLLVENTEEELEYALMHNLVLETMDNLEVGVIYPESVLYNLYSDEQITFLKSDRTKNYYNAVPTIVTKQTSIYSHIPLRSYYYETRIMETFNQGLSQLNTTNTDTYKNMSISLCKEYINVISDDDNVNIDIKNSLVSSFYVTPLSAKYWSNKVNNLSL
ncbi:MAG: hypothetical protein NC036_05770 [Muribaculaceae bacterium]|nr:hypothetical protein [Muribaculaceae bacterium]